MNPSFYSRIFFSLISLLFINLTIRAQEPAPQYSSSAPTTNTAPASSKPLRLPPPPRHPEDAITAAPVAGLRKHAQLLKRAADKNIRLVFLGDSITDFWQSRGLTVWNQYYAKYDAADFGVSGETTEQTLGHIAGGILDGLNPKAVVIMIGTNNIGHFKDEQPERVAAGIQKIVITVRGKLPQSQIVLLAIFPRGKKGDLNRTRAESVNAIISKIDFGPQVHYLDLGSKFLDQNGELPKEIFPDLLHPTAQGYQVWAENMQPVLDPLLK